MGIAMFKGILIGRKTDRSGSAMASLSRLRLGLCVATIGSVFVCMPLASAPSFAAEDQKITATASDIKAAYIFNFIRFTDWPTLRDKTDGRLRLNVLNDQKVYDTLDMLSEEKVAKDMKLEVQSCLSEACLHQSSIIFIGQSDGIQYQKLLKSLNGQPVLTISDIPGFARNGGMIEIKQDGDRMTFTINLDRVKKSDLYVSAQLLQLANVIRGDRLQFAIVNGDQ